MQTMTAITAIIDGVSSEIRVVDILLAIEAEVVVRTMASLCSSLML